MFALFPEPAHVQIVPIAQLFEKKHIAPIALTANLHICGIFAGGSVIAVVADDLYESSHNRPSTGFASEVCKVILRDRHHRHGTVATMLEVQVG